MAVDRLEERRRRRQANLLRNAARQIEMAALLLGSGFGDGAFFHVYTALENMMGAVLLQHNQPIADHHHDDIDEGIKCLQITNPSVAERAESVSPGWRVGPELGASMSERMGCCLVTASSSGPRSSGSSSRK